MDFFVIRPFITLFLVVVLVETIFYIIWKKYYPNGSIIRYFLRTIHNEEIYLDKFPHIILKLALFFILFFIAIQTLRA